LIFGWDHGPELDEMRLRAAQPWGGFVLGFATVDLLTREDTLTVWLTSVEGAHAGHTNAVIFNLGEETVPRRALGMLCDRYMVLTDRTPRGHPLLISWGAEPCDMAMLAEQATLAQATLMTAFEEYRRKPGKGELVEPVLSPVPPPLDQTSLEGGTPQHLTLAVANQVMRTWTAWLTTERERVKRWAYMPGGHKGEIPALFPAMFVKSSTVQPITSLLQ
jgi:hypothetical protein